MTNRVRYRMALATAVLAVPLGVNAQPAQDTLVIAHTVDVESFEPNMLNQMGSINVAGHIFGTLLSITQEGEIVPHFATDYEWNDEGNEIAFTIRDGLTCEDGEILNAEDVAYTLNRAADPDNAFIGHSSSFVFNSIGFESARAEGPNRAVMTLSGYSSIVPGMMSMVFIHCQDSYESMSLDEALVSPVGSGPYRLAEWISNDRVVLERNPSYTLVEPEFDRVIWRVVPEPSTRAAELLAGNIDIAANILPDQADAINASDAATVVSIAGTRRMFAGFNFSDTFADTPAGEAIQDVRVRQALNMAVDVPTICRQLLGTECERANGPANLGNPDIEPYPYDPEMAEALLDEAGWPRGDDGIRFSMTMQGPSGRYLNDAQVQQTIAQYLSDVGVQTTNDLMAMSLFSPMAREHRAGPLFFIGQGGATWSSVYDMSLFPSRDAPVNNGMWFNEGWQSRWDSLSDIRDPDELRSVTNEMLALFHEDAPWIFLYFQPDFYGISSRLAWEPRPDERIKGWTAGRR